MNTPTPFEIVRDSTSTVLEAYLEAADKILGAYEKAAPHRGITLSAEDVAKVAELAEEADKDPRWEPLKKRADALGVDLSDIMP